MNDEVDDSPEWAEVEMRVFVEAEREIKSPIRLGGVGVASGKRSIRYGDDAFFRFAHERFRIRR